ncbi:pyrroloquinoline quinone biosynthesis protein PqqB [Oecophyllibacter saccharovorans]|uniref:pyrroloquinoline quinone biosynthesis protein PqqB n=1 Tax=Oecophyllibacter saccharovorans TaxID=2558360 RepID=UPI00116A4479|nr:pyrroloquinoline quinone biosynthesis protein PqqB [Oecophyllibacter saccharovorans]TPW35415.1 pyrroloquinoline quinone biosynthesis protein PqqB [Oecophyllibacter saccharovorans]
MLDVIVLGAAAGGGFPQWNSAAPGCLAARNGLKQDQRAPENPPDAAPACAKPRSQASLAFSGDGKHWFLINASPDLRAQILATPELQQPAPRQAGDPVRGTPIAGVLLTGAEIDAAVGLLTLREREPFTLWGSASTLAQLDANPMFEALDRDIVKREKLALDVPFPLPLKDGTPSGLVCEAFAVPGKAPLYAEKEGSQPDETLGFSITGGGRTLVVVPGCAEITPSLIERARKADLFFFDGTLWRDDEMIRAGLSPKSGHRMGHVSVTGDDGPLRHFAACARPRKVLIHINNSNPVLLENSPERSQAEAAGWTVAEDGMRFHLESPPGPQAGAPGESQP